MVDRGVKKGEIKYKITDFTSTECCDFLMCDMQTQWQVKAAVRPGARATWKKLNFYPVIILKLFKHKATVSKIKHVLSKQKKKTEQAEG